MLETEDGFVLAVVDHIEDAHLKPLDEVRGDIIKIWSENEKSAMAQEIVNDVVADLDNGETLADIASRFKLNLKTTAPLKRGSAFGKLNSMQLSDAYQTPMGEYKLLSSGGVTTIVTPVKVINHTQAASAKQLEEINSRMTSELEQTLASDLIDAYAKGMDVRVKYRLLGLED